MSRLVKRASLNILHTLKSQFLIRSWSRLLILTFQKPCLDMLRKSRPFPKPCHDVLRNLDLDLDWSRLSRPPSLIIFRSYKLKLSSSSKWLWCVSRFSRRNDENDKFNFRLHSLQNISADLITFPNKICLNVPLFDVSFSQKEFSFSKIIFQPLTT